jgi:hypothetical protein
MELSLPGDTRAADEWLGSMIGPILTEFDRQWRQANEEVWKEQFARRERMTMRMAELDQIDHAKQTREEQWEFIWLSEQLRPDFDPLPSYERYKADHPTDRAADLAIGRFCFTATMKSALQHYSPELPTNSMPENAALTTRSSRTQRTATTSSWLKSGNDVQSSTMI